MFRLNKWYLLFAGLIAAIELVIWIILFTVQKDLVEPTFVGFMIFNFIVLLGILIYFFRIGKGKRYEDIKIEETDELLVKLYLGEEVKEINKKDLINVRKRNGLNLIGITLASVVISVVLYLTAIV